jgi:hypothetical protein
MAAQDGLWHSFLSCAQVTGWQLRRCALYAPPACRYKQCSVGLIPNNIASMQYKVPEQYFFNAEKMHLKHDH